MQREICLINQRLQGDNLHVHIANRIRAIIQRELDYFRTIYTITTPSVKKVPFWKGKVVMFLLAKRRSPFRTKAGSHDNRQKNGNFISSARAVIRNHNSNYQGITYKINRKIYKESHAVRKWDTAHVNTGPW